MLTTEEQLKPLAPVHQKALRWFAEREGAEISWPQPVDGLFLLNKAKGIHKPAGWRHALSVRQSLGGQYADKEVKAQSDGSWTYDYFQEGADPAKRDDDYTNVALMRNLTDSVPVAVVHQVKAKPLPRYKITGLALVTGWKSGYFSFAGSHWGSVGVAGSETGASGAPPISLEDARRRIERAIVARQGAGPFRAAALKAFNGRCAITGCEVEAVLEAAHIVPYLGAHTNSLANSLLLRADLHTLFDRGLLTIDPESLIISMAPSLRVGSYQSLHGVSIRLPSASASEWRRALAQRADLGCAKIVLSPS